MVTVVSLLRWHILCSAFLPVGLQCVYILLPSFLLKICLKNKGIHCFNVFNYNFLFIDLFFPFLKYNLITLIQNLKPRRFKHFNSKINLSRIVSKLLVTYYKEIWIYTR